MPLPLGIVENNTATAVVIGLIICIESDGPSDSLSLYVASMTVAYHWMRRAAYIWDATRIIDSLCETEKREHEQQHSITCTHNDKLFHVYHELAV